MNYERDAEHRLPLQYFVGKGPRGYQRSDERIQEEIWTLLMAENELDLSEIEVDVQGGEVTLMGTLPNRQIKYRLENKIADCMGVKDVINRIRILKKFKDAE